MMIFEHSKGIHRQPVGFGPAPGPRQDSEGKRFDYSHAKMTTVGIVVKCSREAVQAILPEGYTLAESSNDMKSTPSVVFTSKSPMACWKRLHCIWHLHQ
jgi:hypothetical protein